MAIKLNFNDIEHAINEDDTDEDIASEYMENEAIELYLTEQYPPVWHDVEMEDDSLIKTIADYRISGTCCSKKCCSSWKQYPLNKHADDLKLISKNDKRLMLLTILRNCAANTDSTRYTRERQRIRFTFRYEPFGVMCAPAFRLLFNIHIDAFKGLLAHLKTSHMSVVPPIHGNTGKKVFKKNMLETKGVTEKVIQFVLSLGKAHGEFSPGRHVRQGDMPEDKNPNILWLPACFTRSAICRMYKKEHDSFPVSRSAFVTLLQREPRLNHIKIRTPRSDMCDFCELQKRKIASTKPHDELKAEKLTEELFAHQKAYREERKIYYNLDNRALWAGVKKALR